VKTLSMANERKGQGGRISIIVFILHTKS